MELLILFLFICLLIKITSKLVNRKGQVHYFTNEEPSHYTNIDLLLEDGIITNHEHKYLIDKINKATL